MASSAEELLVIAKLRNEISRPIKAVKGDMASLRAEIARSGTATAEQSRQLRALQREYDKSSRKLGAYGQKLRDLGSKWTREFTVPIVAGFGLAAKAAIDDQRSQTVLAATMRNTTHASNTQIKATEAWIRKTQFATGVSDNDLRPALAKLMQAHFGVEGSQTMLNLAMDVSVARGKDLNSVVEALAKAHVGNATALKRLGIQTTDATGRALTFDQIVTKLAATMGGSMAAAADTTAGRLARLRERAREAGEDLGMKLLPAVDRGARLMSGFLDTVDRLGPAGQGFLIFGGLALAAVGPVVRLAGSVMTLAKAYREWQAARAAGTATSLLGAEGLISGGAALGVGAGAVLVGGSIAQGAIEWKRASASQRAAAQVAGRGGLTGATQQQRLSSIAALNAEIARRRSRGGPNFLDRYIIGTFGGTPNQRVGDLEKQKSKIQAAYRAEQHNVSSLTRELGLNEREVRRLATASGVDLAGKLADVSSSMKAAAAAAKINSVAVTDQEDRYKRLSDSITVVQGAQARLLDPFLNFKQSQLDYLDALDAYRKAQTPRERSAAAIGLVRAGSSYIGAGVQAGEYGPNGLTPAAQAANLLALVKPVLGPNDSLIRQFVESYYAHAANEDPAGVKSLAQQLNTFNITQNFGKDVNAKVVREAAQDGFDAAARASAHREELQSFYYPRPTAGRF